MNNLCVFYGDDILRDGPQGLDLSRCQSQFVTVEGLPQSNFRDVRRRICTLFGPEMARKKMVVEAVQRSYRDISFIPLHQLQIPTPTTSKWWIKLVLLVCIRVRLK